MAYPMPTVTDALNVLSGGKIFSRLDMSQAYLQLPVDSESSEVLAINTMKGLFKVKRLPFGLSASPGIFQRHMEMLLSDIPGISIYLDDVIISGRTREEHDQRVDQVLRRMSEAKLLLNKAKCEFSMTSVTFLGFKVDAEGIRPTPEKLEAIQKAPIPQNKSELQAFLGLVNFYNQFLKSKASVAEPLYRLLEKGAPWKFGEREKQAFDKIKQLIVSSDILIHYDPTKELFLTCDASPVGVGAILSHLDQQGNHRPIAFASRTLSKAERNYSQTDREALAIIYGAKKFHSYLAGRHAIIQTDHKPLLGLFSPSKQIPQIISPRMLRWCLMLAAYDYDLKYVPGKNISNVDALSRLPIQSTLEDEVRFPDPVDVFMIESDTLPINVQDIQAESEADEIISNVYQHVHQGTPLPSTDISLIPYANRFDELSIQKNCLLWGARVVIPTSLRHRVLQELHALHPGIVSMKSMARSLVWWPKIDDDITQFVNNCATCQSHKHLPPRVPSEGWNIPDLVWSRLHIDLMKTSSGANIFLVVDATSKWLEAEMLNTPTTSSIIAVLRRIFATHGLPKTIVSDNASVFIAETFQQFLRKNGVHHIRTAPFHPSSNGQIERYVQEVKKALKHLSRGDLKTKLARYLLHQHTTAHATTGTSPDELLLGRKLRTALHLLHPDLSEVDATSSNSNPRRTFSLCDEVQVYQPKGPTKWLPGIITRELGNYLYEVRLEDGSVQRRHINQLRPNLMQVGRSVV